MGKPSLALVGLLGKSHKANKACTSMACHEKTSSYYRNLKDITSPCKTGEVILWEVNMTEKEENKFRSETFFFLL